MTTIFQVDAILTLVSPRSPWECRRILLAITIWRHVAPHLAVLKFVQIYPLVNVYIAVENHHFLAG